MSLLKTLVQSRHLKAVVHILENILPLVYHCQFYLLKNEQLRTFMLNYFHFLSDFTVP